jgi:DNA-binding YbaB/EbfC family protein
MTDFMKMLQQAQQMTGKLQEVQDTLGKLSVVGTAGGGLVRVEADGKGTVKRVSIDPAVANPADVEMLEDLVTVAMQEAQKKARELSESEMKKVAGGLGLGGLPFKLPF